MENKFLNISVGNTSPNNIERQECNRFKLQEKMQQFKLRNKKCCCLKFEGRSWVGVVMKQQVELCVGSMACVVTHTHHVNCYCPRARYVVSTVPSIIITTTQPTVKNMTLFLPLQQQHNPQYSKEYGVVLYVYQLQYSIVKIWRCFCANNYYNTVQQKHVVNCLCAVNYNTVQ